MVSFSEGTTLMKTDLSYLPENKQSELLLVTEIIKKAAKIKMIILFGSYARNDWVEDKYDEEHYRYQSDMDVLVIVEAKGDGAQAKLERDIEIMIDEELNIKTPVSVIVHDIDFVNRRLSKAQYFFTDIKKEGVVLYSSGHCELKETKELLPFERKRLAQDDFEYYFDKANGFREGVDFYLGKGRLNEAAFLLHQATERLYAGILLVFTRYKPNTHDLAILRKLANSLDNVLLHVFPLDTSENRRLFKLLRKAYVDARYKPNYKIEESELNILIQNVDELLTIGKKICQEKINRFLYSSTPDN